MGRNCKKAKITFIAITGPTASGKSILSSKLSKVFGKEKCAVICQDDYYNDWSRLPKNRRKKINFDDAGAFDFSLLNKHIIELRRGACINKPCYGFAENKRLSRTQKIKSKPIIIIEGLMPFLKDRIRKLFDLKVYIDIDNAECLSRRLRRDIAERAETVESVCRRYFAEVLPMQRRYVERQKKWADMVIDGADCCNPKIIRKIKDICLKNR